MFSIMPGIQTLYICYMANSILGNITRQYMHRLRISCTGIRRIANHMLATTMPDNTMQGIVRYGIG